MEPAFRGLCMGRAWDQGTGIDGHRVLRRWDRHRFDGGTRLLLKGRLGLPGHARIALPRMMKRGVCRCWIGVSIVVPSDTLVS